MSVTDWCHGCGDITVLVDDGFGGKACGECGYTNTIQSEAALYHTTVGYDGGEFTLSDEQVTVHHSDAESQWLAVVERKFHLMAQTMFKDNRSALVLDYVNPGRSTFYERCMRIYGIWRGWELEPGSMRARKRDPDASRLPFQLASTIMLVVHESNLALAQRDITEAFFQSGAKRTVADAAARFPVSQEVKAKLNKSSNRLYDRFTELAQLANVDVSDLACLVRDIAYIRQHIRELATTKDGLFASIRGDKPATIERGTRYILEQKFLSRLQGFTDQDWKQVMEYAYNMAHVAIHEGHHLKYRSYILAIAITTWSIQGVCGFVIPQHRSICVGIASIWAPGSVTVEHAYILIRQTLIIWGADFGACGIPRPIVARSDRCNTIGDGLTGYGGDSRRGIPDSDIAIAALPVVARDWRKLLAYRRNATRPVSTLAQALQATRIAFAKATNEYHGVARVPVGQGATCQVRKKAPIASRSFPLIVPSPNSRAPDEIYAFLEDWRKRLPKRRSLPYMMAHGLSQRDIDNGTLQGWIDKQRWRWCPVEAWMRTLCRAEHLPLSLLPKDLASLKRDFEYAEQLAEERRGVDEPFEEVIWMSEVRHVDPELREASEGLLGLAQDGLGLTGMVRAPEMSVLGKRKGEIVEMDTKRPTVTLPKPQSILPAAAQSCLPIHPHILPDPIAIKPEPSPSPIQILRPLPPDQTIASNTIDKQQIHYEYTIILPSLPNIKAQPTKLQLDEIATRARVYKLQSEHYLLEARGNLPHPNQKARVVEPPKQQSAREHRLVVAMTHHRECVTQYHYLRQFAPNGHPDVLESFRRAAWWCIDRGFAWEPLAHLSPERNIGVPRIRADLAKGKTPAEALRNSGVPLKDAPAEDKLYWQLPAYGTVKVPGTTMLVDLTAEYKTQAGRLEAVRVAEEDVRRLIQPKKGRAAASA